MPLTVEWHQRPTGDGKILHRVIVSECRKRPNAPDYHYIVMVSEDVDKEVLLARLKAKGVTP